MTDNNEDDIIDRFLLKINEEPVQRKGKYWMISKAYISDISIAIHIVPACNIKNLNDNSIASAKNELNVLLRLISHLSLDHDLMRPVAGVISEKELKNQGYTKEDYKSWESDQDWHRGAFTLYIEQDEEVNSEAGKSFTVKDRVKDLIDPIVPSFVAEKKEPRDMEKIIKTVFEDVLKKGQYEDIYPIISGLQSILRDASKQEGHPDDYKNKIDSWIEAVKQV